MQETFDYQAAMDDLDQRIAVLRRYRRLLDLQREGLQTYLAVIEQRDKAHAEGQLEGFEDFALQEQGAVKSIMAVQRCLPPLKALYLSLHPEGSPEIADLELRLERLRTEVLKKNEESRLVLRAHADQIRQELRKLRPQVGGRSVYGQTAAPRLMDVHA